MSKMAEIRKTAGKYVSLPALRLLPFKKLSPNALTVTGFLVSLLAAFFIARGSFIWGGFLILVAGLFDILDGAAARAQGKVTDFGAALDSTLDRYMEAALLFALLWFYVPQGNFGIAILIYASLVGSLLVSYVRARAEGLGLKGESGFFTRAERIVVLALGLLLNQVVIVLWALALLTHFTVAQRLMDVWKQTKQKK